MNKIAEWIERQGEGVTGIMVAIVAIVAWIGGGICTVKAIMAGGKQDYKQVAIFAVLAIVCFVVGFLFTGRMFYNTAETVSGDGFFA